LVKDEKVKGFISINNRILSILVFSLYFSWLLAVPFEGQILYAFGSKYELNISPMVFSSIAAHLLGLIISGFFIKNINSAKTLMLLSIVIVIAGNFVFFFKASIFWNISLVITAFLAGASVSAWGFFFRRYTPPDKRLNTAANVLIYSNILMIALNMTAVHITSEAGLAFAQILLAGALFFTFKLPVDALSDHGDYLKITKNINLVKPFALLFLFIFIITINSGLMYQVFNPAFAHLESIVSWYWAVPYIIALFIMRNLPEKTNRTYILYVVIAMIGLSFVFFMTFDHSIPSYFLINTLMLGACGVYDIFWWSILGSMLDYYENPARVLGWGLSANVLGVLVGGMAGKCYYQYGCSIYSLIIKHLTAGQAKLLWFLVL